MGPSKQWETLKVEDAGVTLSARWSPAPEPRGKPAVILVGGVGGGFDSPALLLYERLAEFLPAAGISLLRLRYRNPTDLEGAVEDVRAGVHWLSREQGVPRCALVGHSFGGAVVIRAAVAEPAVASVVTLAAQSYGTGNAAELRRPILLLHGTEDAILPSQCSVDIARRVGPTAQLRLHEGTDHGLDEVAEDVLSQVNAFLVETLAASVGLHA